MKSINKNILPWLILIIIGTLLIQYISKNILSFKQLFLIGLKNPGFIILIGTIILIIIILNGILLKYLICPFRINLKNIEAFGLSIITKFYNLITPFRGGAVARAVYLNKKHDFPYIHFLATLSAIYILIFLTSSIMGVISMLSLLKENLFNTTIFITLSTLSILLIIIIIFSPKLKEVKNKWLNRFIKVINGWHLIKNNKKIIIITIIISLLQLFLIALNNLIAYHLFGIQITLAKALFIAAISNLSIIVAITPGNLGIGDAINVFIANMIGIPLTEAIAATILLRAINLAVILILGPIFSYYLTKKNETNPK
jgi:uncharacterized membrane protein YbhN (UPF0104 family)